MATEDVRSAVGFVSEHRKREHRKWGHPIFAFCHLKSKWVLVNQTSQNLDDKHPLKLKGASINYGGSSNNGRSPSSSDRIYMMNKMGGCLYHANHVYPVSEVLLGPQVNTLDATDLHAATWKLGGFWSIKPVKTSMRNNHSKQKEPRSMVKALQTWLSPFATSVC